MILGIVIVGWVVGTVSVALAVVLGDPGLLGAVGVFLTTSIIASLAAALSYALRPDGRDDLTDDATADTPAGWSAPAARADLPLAAVARTADPLAEPGYQRPS